MSDARKYFIVQDTLAIPGSNRLPTFQLMHGDPGTTTGLGVAKSESLAELIGKLPPTEPVYYAFLERTEGRRGSYLLRAPNESMESAYLRKMSEDMLQLIEECRTGPNALPEPVAERLQNGFSTVMQVELWRCKQACGDQRPAASTVAPDEEWAAPRGR